MAHNIDTPRVNHNFIRLPMRLSCLALLLLAQQLSAQAPDSLAVSAAELGARLRFLSSDLFEGRYPGKRSEELTTHYLISELQTFGVHAGAAPGDTTTAGWLQPVELFVQRPDSGSPASARITGRVTLDLVPGQDVTFVNAGRSPDVSAAGELVFVGYGIDAPMYHWNDF